MKITGQQPSSLAELSAGKSQDRAAESARSTLGRPQDTAPESNRMSLTTNKVKDAIRNEPDVRSGRIQEIKERLKNGDYKVNTDELAKNMLTASLREDLDIP